MAKGTKHDILEFAFAKAVTKDYPYLIRLFDAVIKKIRPHQKYKSVWLAYQSLNDSKRMMEMHLKHYKKVNEQKGRVE